jgi:hypothetical protein
VSSYDNPPATSDWLPFRIEYHDLAFGSALTHTFELYGSSVVEGCSVYGAGLASAGAVTFALAGGAVFAAAFIPATTAYFAWQSGPLGFVFAQSEQLVVSNLVTTTDVDIALWGRYFPVPPVT